MPYRPIRVTNPRAQCWSCRYLVDSDASVCPECGGKLIVPEHIVTDYQAVQRARRFRRRLMGALAGAPVVLAGAMTLVTGNLLYVTASVIGGMLLAAPGMLAVLLDSTCQTRERSWLMRHRVDDRERFFGILVYFCAGLYVVGWVVWLIGIMN